MLIRGDTLVLDRWHWIRKHLPRTANGEWIIDVGCGSGAFTVGAAKRGYDALGLTWDEAERSKAAARAAHVKLTTPKFETFDVRDLGSRVDLADTFDVALCCENIEHVLDDAKLMTDISGVLKPGGRLLLTTPNYDYRPISAGDLGPFSPIENGGHVRRGYTPAHLIELCEIAGLEPEEISYCSGLLSQKITALLRKLSAVNYLMAWLIILALRPLPLFFDHLIARLTGWPGYSICLVAYKPRFATTSASILRRRDAIDVLQIKVG